MDAASHIDSITRAEFDSVLAQYPDIVPSKLKDLDIIRYSTIPDSKPAYLNHEQAVQLVDWKLSHGTFRPKLKQLVESNASDFVEETTKSAFSSFDGTPEKAASCLKALTVLKGIGPATASLLLSVYSPEEAPFFSDELFRWSMWKSGKGQGWDRPIKYTPKEYAELFAKVAHLRERIGVNAVDSEKVAYVLGKTAKAKPVGVGKESASTLKRKADGEGEVVETKDVPVKKVKIGDSEKPITKPKTPSAATKGNPKPTRASARIKANGK